MAINQQLWLHWYYKKIKYIVLMYLLAIEVQKPTCSQSVRLLYSWTSRRLLQTYTPYSKTMATASIVQLQAVDKPQFYRPPISQSSTDKANELLQDNHERHHIFFNADGFHNHIAHQLLTIWSLGATPEELQRGYDTNKSYQRPARKPESTIVQGLQDPATFISHLGVEQHYNDFLEFFRQEIDKKGWQHVLKQYVFAGDERAETMLVRMFAGLLHPIIHLGFGLEFQQPAIIAEALAQAACHDDWIGEVLLPAEEAAKKNGNSDKTIVELIDEIHNHKEIREAPRW